MDNTKKINRQITKFGLYGFFKNLRFFDPILLIFLYSFGLSAFQIGILYAIREIMIYIFEIPSGVFADQYGKKTELIICFVFYVLSFIVFAIGTNFYVFAIAMILFGLGEAFRSGTHKSIIMLFLDMHDLSDIKSKIYGKTRSYSMIGSMVSSLFTIVLVMTVSDLKFLFILAIIPYLIDIGLVLSYPKVLNDKKQIHFNWKYFIKENINAIKYVFKDHQMRNILISSSSFQAMFKILKDFIQLILVSIPITYLLFSQYDSEQHVKIYAAIMYAFIFLISAITSRNAYLLLKLRNAKSIVKTMWLMSGISSLIIGIFVQQILIVFIGFILLYICLNIRKPLMVEIIGDYANKDKRASVLSVDSQLTSLFIVIFAPILGFLSDTYSLSFMFILVGIIMVITYILLTLRHNTNKKVLH